MTVRTLIYRRISSDPTGRAAGVQRQDDDCRALADQLGWTILDGVLEPDNDISAYSGKARPQYQKLLEELRAGRADAVLAWHPDRLYRRLVELEEFIDVVNTHHIAVRTVKAGEMDLSSPTGRAMARTAAVWSGHEIEHGIERMRAAKEQAASRGEYRGGARPFGYEPDGVTIRESEAREIRDATRRLLAGESAGSIIADWNRRGVPTPRGAAQWRRTSLVAVVVRARNAGKIEKVEAGRRFGEIVGPAVWPALVPEHELLAVRALLVDPARRRTDNYRGERRHLGSGLFLCGICCDGTPVKLGGGESRARQRDGVYAGSYRCRKFVHCTRALHPIDVYVDEVMREILKRPETRLRIYDVPETDLAALQAEATSIEEEIAGLRVDLGRREITRQDFKVAKAGMEEDLAKVTAKLSAAAARSPLAGIADADDVDLAWGGATLGRKRAVIDVLATVTLLPGQRGRQRGGSYFDPGSVVIEPRG